MLKVKYNDIEQTVNIGEFYSNELRINKLGISISSIEDELTFTYIHEIEVGRNTKSLFVLLLLLETYSSGSIKPKINVAFDYLPFSRMDKPDNQYEETLAPFIRLVGKYSNSLTTVSVHSKVPFENHFNWHDEDSEHVKTVSKLATEPNTYLVAVDAGSKKRYTNLNFPIEFAKKRVNGTITQQEVVLGSEILDGKGEKTFILIDDICSMGITFTNVGKELKKLEPNCHLHVYVHFMEAQALNIGLNSDLFKTFDSVKFVKII